MRKYASPKLDILEFDVDDVITASSPSGSPDNPVDPAATETENAYGSFGSFDQTPANGWF